MRDTILGQSNVEFSLIGICITVAAIASITAFGGNFNNLFAQITDSNSAIDSSNTNTRLLSLNNSSTFNKNYTLNLSDYKAGFLGGTLQSPKESCSNGSCIIDYGDFVLSGIPENFNEYIETNGVSGGSDTLMGILNQLSTVLAEEGLTEESQKIKDLANLGHNIAKIESSLEKYVDNCQGDHACLISYANTPLPMPSGYNTSIGTFPTGYQYFGDLSESGSYTENAARSLVLVGSARCHISGTDTECQARGPINEDIPAYQYVLKFDEVMGSPQINDSIKGIVQELTRTLGHMGEDFEETLVVLQDDPSITGIRSSHSWDPITGEVVLGQMDFTNKTPYEYYDSYDASGTSNLTSALKCGAAKAADQNNTCS